MAFNPKHPNSPDPLRDRIERGTSLSSYVPASLPGTTFKRMIVLDVVSDPVNAVDINNKKRDYWINVLGVSNSKFAPVLPRNTIVAQLAYSERRPLFVFPFFPSHLALPCKPGEMVWAIVEDPDQVDFEVAYWMCRITDLHHGDDVNHAHPTRAFDYSFAGVEKTSKRERSTNDGKTLPIYELRNGDADPTYEGSRRTNFNTSPIVTTKQEDVFERLVTYTDGARLMQYEAVPRFKKRPGDIALEGSNNSLIVLGTDRANTAGEYSSSNTNDNGPQPNIPSFDLIGDAGSIDLVVGRGQATYTFGREVSTTSIIGSEGGKLGPEIKKELGKSEDEIVPEEGDFDLLNDRSRIQISQRTKVDEKFEIDAFNSAQFEVSDSNDGDAAIVIKTDKIRLIARSDVEILVTGFKDAKNAKGKDIKSDNRQDDDDDKFAAIIIKADGNIIFKPSETGYIKLGDNDADRAILCTDLPATLLDGEVSPTTAPLSNTMGGRFGGTGIPTQGTWASKVLVTGAR